MCKRIGIALLCLALTACAPLEALQSAFSGEKATDLAAITATGVYFDTVVTITLYGEEQADLLEEALALCGYYDGLLSRTIEGSDIYRINAAAGTWVEVSQETYQLIATALEFCQATDGALDITVASVKDLWDFTPAGEVDASAIPTEGAIAEALTHVDYHGILLEERALEGEDEAGATYYVMLQDPEASMDLGCIAKGYIADRLKAFLLENGVESGIINLGGNVVTIGYKPGGATYTIGIETPFETATVFDTVSVADLTVVTSGVYERYITVDGQLYHHILDTHTGYPVQNDLYSVTIITDDSTTADALSTACLALGMETAIKLLDT